MHNPKSMIYKVAGIFSLLFLVIVAVALKVTTAPLSIEELGQVGDFFGGILNPLLALVNICVFVWLTTTIQLASEKYDKESIASTERSTLIQLRHAEYSQFKVSLDPVMQRWLEAPRERVRFRDLLVTFNTAEYRMAFLFPTLSGLKESRDLRAYISDVYRKFESGDLDEINPNGIANTYGMLISRLGELVLK